MPDLVADCSRCAALCCVALPFGASADFALDKPGGVPCPNLQDTFRCGIHSALLDKGFPGCTTFDCFGAGQETTSRFAGRDWRQSPAKAQEMFEEFVALRGVHELLFMIADALERPQAAGLSSALEATRARLLEAAERPRGVDLNLARAELAPLLRQVSAAVRGECEARTARVRGRERAIEAGADLAGVDLSGRDLRGVDLRGALLIGADLTGADLRTADFLGTDLRAARIGAADLTGALFLTQGQANAARGDAGTRLPATLARPGHWR